MKLVFCDTNAFLSMYLVYDVAGTLGATYIKYVRVQMLRNTIFLKILFYTCKIVIVCVY